MISLIVYVIYGVNVFSGDIYKIAFLASETILMLNLETDMMTAYNIYSKMNETCEWRNSSILENLSYAVMAANGDELDISNLDTSYLTSKGMHSDSKELKECSMTPFIWSSSASTLVGVLIDLWFAYLIYRQYRRKMRRNRHRVEPISRQYRRRLNARF